MSTLLKSREFACNFYILLHILLLSYFCSYIVFFHCRIICHYTPKFIQIFKSLNLDNNFQFHSCSDYVDFYEHYIFAIHWNILLPIVHSFLTYSSYYIHYKNLSFVKTFKHLNLVTLHFIQNNTYVTFCINSVIFILACYNHNCIIYNLLYYTYI